MNNVVKFAADVNAMWDIARRNGCKTNIDISERMNANRNTVGDVMSERQQPSADFMYKFAMAFHLAPKDDILRR